MKLNVKAFGIAKDIVGGASIDVELEIGASVADLLAQMEEQFPEFSKLASLAIAVNAVYAERSQIIQSSDEVVIIPPVAGG